MNKKCLRDPIIISELLIEEVDSRFDNAKEREAAYRAYCKYGFYGEEPDEKYSFVKDIFNRIQKEATE